MASIWHRFWSGRLLLCLLVPLSGLVHAQVTVDSTYRSSIFVLSQCKQVRRDREFSRILLALRQMKDPTLAPLFQGLIAEEHPALKVHGLLGMAQIDPDGMVDLTRIVSLDNRVTQSQALSAALDSKLAIRSSSPTLTHSWPRGFHDLGSRFGVSPN